MKKIALSDIRGPKLYAGFRDDLRKRVIELKRRRRVSVGPLVTLVFENRTTVIGQIEEMCRAEGLETPEKMAEEVAVYNELIPDHGEVSATLFVELTDQATLETSLNSLVGLQDHVYIRIGPCSVRATFDPEQFRADKLAAVQYLRFAFSTDAQQALTSGQPLSLHVDHPNYTHDTRMSDDTRAELVADLGLVA
ncbi:MAG: DUF3501 family protein [Polyangia bacterium]